jgi:hypothetical protein
MISLECALLNSSDKDLFASIFEGYGKYFEYTSDGVFRRIKKPICPCCSVKMSYNGYNTYTKH